MSRPDPRFTASPRLPIDAEGPVFAEPWQAQAFALTVQLHAQGAFSWSDWAKVLSEELAAADARGEPDDGTRYYEHWLAALERLSQSSGLAGAQEMVNRKAQWAQAYLNTPHGQPVVLPADAET